MHEIDRRGGGGVLWGRPQNWVYLQIRLQLINATPNDDELCKVTVSVILKTLHTKLAMSYSQQYP